MRVAFLGATKGMGRALARQMAERGDTILLRPGTYRESVTVPPGVTIMGDGQRGDIIVEHDDDAPFVMDGEDSTLRSLTVRADVWGGLLGLDAAIRVQARGVMLEGVSVSTRVSVEQAWAGRAQRSGGPW